MSLSRLVCGSRQAEKDGHSGSVDSDEAWEVEDRYEAAALDLEEAAMVVGDELVSEDTHETQQDDREEQLRLARIQVWRTFSFANHFFMQK